MQTPQIFCARAFERERMPGSSRTILPLRMKSSAVEHLGAKSCGLLSNDEWNIKINIPRAICSWAPGRAGPGDPPSFRTSGIIADEFDETAYIRFAKGAALSESGS